MPAPLGHGDVADRQGRHVSSLVIVPSPCRPSDRGVGGTRQHDGEGFVGLVSVSPLTATVIVCWVSPGAKVSVPWRPVVGADAGGAGGGVVGDGHGWPLAARQA